MNVVSKHLFVQNYLTCYKNMLKEVKKSPSSPDQIWSLEHDPVITLGKSADFSGILNSKGLPIVETDRGGKTTYHGPGQLVLYTIINYRRSKLSPRKLVTILEQSMIDLLALKGLTGSRKDGAPGIYIDDKKIGSIGLRFGKNFSYHGMALNVNMDLSPFDEIYTCGYKNLEVTQLANFNINVSLIECATELRSILINLIYNRRESKINLKREKNGK